MCCCRGVWEAIKASFGLQYSSAASYGVSFFVVTAAATAGLWAWSGAGTGAVDGEGQQVCRQDMLPCIACCTRSID